MSQLEFNLPVYCVSHPAYEPAANSLGRFLSSLETAVQALEAPFDPSHVRGLDNAPMAIDMKAKKFNSTMNRTQEDFIRMYLQIEL